jgi:hypothetical protein
MCDLSHLQSGRWNLVMAPNRGEQHVCGHGAMACSHASGEHAPDCSACQVHCALPADLPPVSPLSVVLPIST